MSHLTCCLLKYNILNLNLKAPVGGSTLPLVTLSIGIQNYPAVGSNEEVDKQIGSVAKKIDLNGRFVLPGLHDSHVQPIKGD